MIEILNTGVRPLPTGNVISTKSCKTSKVEVSTCVSKVNLDDYVGLILIGGYAMDRLRYETKVGVKNEAPAVNLLRQAVSKMDNNQLAIGTICHSMWLFCADTSLLKGREIT